MKVMNEDKSAMLSYFSIDDSVVQDKVLEGVIVSIGILFFLWYWYENIYIVR